MIVNKLSRWLKIMNIDSKIMKIKKKLKKSPFMIYEDLIYESILVPEDNGKQNQIKQIKETICL